MAFDFINDEKLNNTLPLALRQRMQKVQEARISAGLTAKDGITYATEERRDAVNARIERLKSN